MKKVFNFTELSQLIHSIKSDIRKSYGHLPADLAAGYYTGIAFEYERGQNKELVVREIMIDNDGLYYRITKQSMDLKLQVSIETLVAVLNGNVTPLGKVA